MTNGLVILVLTYEGYGIKEERYLGEDIYEELRRMGRDDVELVYACATKFRDSSQKVEITKSVRNKDVYIIHPIYTDAAEHIMLAAEAGQAAKLGDASSVVLIEPYNRYFRQDRRTGREPVTARLVAELYEDAGIDHVFTLDAHTEQIQMAFNTKCSIETLPSTKLISNYIKDNYSTENVVVCSPDTGAVKRARSLANSLGLPMAIIHKRRIREGVLDEETLDVIGDVEGKTVFIRDDVTSTFTTLIHASESLKSAGAKDVYACVTHLDIDDEAKEKLMGSDIHVIGTNSVPVDLTDKEKERIDIIDIAPLLACVISMRSKGESIAKFFQTSSDNKFDS
ncbi:hypothetical protein A3K63_05020 [Candidatus Micrarchaeota archaeon RBG_16_49_10]|nr:MAG: hypothetical protein A3K63_05020 [Candidatus Micrarchaeota archaeon RBG_16_49_10]